jgi:site-specific DNA-methyltransferase (cytosine-N4-specific)
VWAELARVLAPGGIACINVGDATRSLSDGFRQYPNHTEITNRLTDQGLRALPDILWRKPTNRGAKFMGSGMVPPNAYPTLEHEHILLFRNGRRRTLEPGADRRYESAYFWEERNEWFSDLWELPGETQAMDDGLRDRSGAFPLAIPHRLVSMFSVRGDTVLDPFLGTGTTTLSAMVAGRDSVGIERDADLLAALDDRVDRVGERSRRLAEDRLDAHREWVTKRRADGKEPGYEAEHYDFAVNTKQERRIRLYAVDDVERTDEGYRVTHTPVE